MDDEPRIENTNEGERAVDDTNTVVEQPVEAPTPEAEQLVEAPMEAAEPIATPEPVAAQSTPVASVEAKKKSNGGLILLIVLLVLLLGASCTLLILQTTGTIHLEKMFGGSTKADGTGGGGSDDFAGPTVEKARAACESRGNYEFVDETESRIDYIAHNDDDYKKEITGIYHCVVKESNEPNVGRSIGMFEYRIVFTKSNYRDIAYYQKFLSGDYSKDDVYEKSDSFVKIGHAYSTSYALAAMYKNAAIELEVKQKDEGHKILADIGFPDRSKVAE